jgi:hypothetical protein
MKSRTSRERVVDTATRLGQALDESPCYPTAAAEEAGAPSLCAVCVGRIVALGDPAPLVDFPSNASGKLIPARALVFVTREDIGGEVALAFEDNDFAKPIILGLLATNNNEARCHSTTKPLEITVDQDRLILSAHKEITLRCGKASITLTSAGKLMIQGEYVVSRSSGVNKIRGGSVQIN